MTMTVAEYYQRCKVHDWFFEYSDDQNVWRSGMHEERYLKSFASDLPTLDRIYKAFYEHYFNKKPVSSLDEFMNM